MSQINFNAAEVELKSNFEPVPPGTYQVMIIGAEVKNTKAGSGKYLALEYTLINNAEHDGRKIFDRIVFEHSNPTVVRIGREQLKKLCVAVGYGDSYVDDTAVFIGQSIAIKVVIEAGRDGYQPDNRVVNYFPY